MDDFIQLWPGRVHGALVEALEYLARHDPSPTSDGMLGEFVDRLVAMKFEPGDGPYIAQLLEKKDAHLVEAGVDLGASFLRDTGDWQQLEGPMVRMIAREPVDAWVALALCNLLSRYRGPAPVYAALAGRHQQRPADDHGIHRNRFITPWKDLEEHYAQLLIQALDASALERAVLPILEKRHGTKGFLETQARILRALGFDPKEHRKLLAQRP